MYKIWWAWAHGVWVWLDLVWAGLGIHGPGLGWAGLRILEPMPNTTGLRLSVTDKAKSDGFDICPDLDLTCDLLTFFISKSTRRELLIAASLLPPVRQLGRDQNLPPPSQRGVFGQIPQRGRVKLTGLTRSWEPHSSPWLYPFLGTVHKI